MALRMVRTGVTYVGEEAVAFPASSKSRLMQWATSSVLAKAREQAPLSQHFGKSSRYILKVNKHRLLMRSATYA
eukprot:12893890-Prorocentrum_lima.AAC.1